LTHHVGHLSKERERALPAREIMVTHERRKGVVLLKGGKRKEVTNIYQSLFMQSHRRISWERKKPGKTRQRRTRGRGGRLSYLEGGAKIVTKGEKKGEPYIYGVAHIQEGDRKRKREATKKKGKGALLDFSGREVQISYPEGKELRRFGKRESGEGGGRRC